MIRAIAGRKRSTSSAISTRMRRPPAKLGRRLRPRLRRTHPRSQNQPRTGTNRAPSRMTSRLSTNSAAAAPTRRASSEPRRSGKSAGEVSASGAPLRFPGVGVMLRPSPSAPPPGRQFAGPASASFRARGLRFPAGISLVHDRSDARRVALWQRSPAGLQLSRGASGLRTAAPRLPWSTGR
jgi:hypothetical protein